MTSQCFLQVCYFQAILEQLKILNYSKMLIASIYQVDMIETLLRCLNVLTVFFILFCDSITSTDVKLLSNKKYLDIIYHQYLAI